MKKDIKTEPLRLFKLSHQILCITGINFDNKSLIGYVELTVWPLKPDLTSIRINSKQSSIYKVTIDRKWEAEFTYFDPMMDICQGNVVKRNIDYFEKCQQNALNAVDPDQGNGELIITLPEDVLPTVAALGSFQVCVEFALEEPRCGLHFVVPDTPGTMAERSAHMFTYATENFSRLWFPCIDTFSEPCTWKIEVTVDRDMTAVACGDLVSVEYTEDMAEKTYHYFLSSPTAAPNIALAVGPFEILVDPKMHEVTHFCLPRLMPVLRHTTSYIHQAFEFYEELMSSRYPYSYYKQVFVDQAYCEVSTYSTMSILSTNLLHPPNTIDQTMASRQLMATAVAQQFFGSFIAMQSWSDAWLTKGITGYLSYLFCKRTFGNNEYRNWVMRDLQEVSEYEQQAGYVILDPSKRDSNHTFSIRSPHTLSPRYAEIFSKKARLVMRMLEIRIGTELFLQVLNKLLSLAYNASQQNFSLSSWINMLLSTSSFLKIIYTVTGKDIEPFIDQWVTQGGVARFNSSFVFNRKRNVVELDIKQDLTALGALKFVGALNVTIQELDGSFNHTFKIEENKTRFEITCHSKSRRNKKKKIPLMTGEEVDMDLSVMDQDSPVLWLRLDPDMHLLRTVTFEQPDYMWQYQLKFERCIVAQFEAIEALGRFPTPASRYALTDTIENEECYYRVRQDACYCLAKIANLMVGSWTGPPAMMTIFRKMFGSHSCPFILRQNNFSNFHHYYLLKTMPQAMARLRDTHSLCLTEVSKFLLDLFKYNDNSRNKWSDNYFRAALVEALAASITPAVTNVSLITGRVATAETLSPDTRLIVEEVVRALNLEKLMPSYKYTVTCSCLYTIRTLQKYGHLPNDSDVFKDYAQPGIFRDVRVAAVTCLVDFIRGDITGEHLYWTLDFIENERDPYLSHHTITCLTQNPPFQRSERSPLNMEPLVEKLWHVMSSTMSMDCRLRCGLAELYHTLYGRQRPTCLPVAESVKQAQKDKKAKAQTESQDSGVGSQQLSQAGGAIEWNPELASMFATEGPPVVGGEEVLLESAERAVDLTMISGEQTVGLEESVVSTEPADHNHHQDGQLDGKDVKPKIELDLEVSVPSVPSGETPADVTETHVSPSHLSEDSASPPQLSPRRGPPEDVIVSLDNIIRSDPSMPARIFEASPSPPQPEASDSEMDRSTVLSLDKEGSAPGSPVKEEVAEAAEAAPAETSAVLHSATEKSAVAVAAAATAAVVVGASSPASSPLHLSEDIEVVDDEDDDDDKIDSKLMTRAIKEEMIEEEEVKEEEEKVSRKRKRSRSPSMSPPLPPPQPQPQLQPQLLSSSLQPSSSLLSTSSSSLPQRSPPSALAPAEPASGNLFLSSSSPPSSSPPSSSSLPQQGALSSLPSSSSIKLDVVKMEVKEERPSSPPPPPLPPPSSSSFSSFSLSTRKRSRDSPPPLPPPPPMSPPSTREFAVKEEEEREGEISAPPPVAMATPDKSLEQPGPTATVLHSTPLPSLKTTLYTGAFLCKNVGGEGSSSRDRERSSHHKSKKKKKKNKHKHKHKHKHDRADRESSEPAAGSERPRERLVLDMSRASASFSSFVANQDASSSDLEM